MHEGSAPDQHAPDSGDSSDGACTPEDRAAQERPAQERVEQMAGRLGRLLGRSAGRARMIGEEIARDARPEVEWLARSARSAADAARPHVEQAGRQALQYVRDHEGEIKRAARVGAQVTAHQVLPTSLRPIVAAVEADRWRRAPYRDERTASGEGGDPSTRDVSSDPPQPV